MYFDIDSVVKTRAEPVYKKFFSKTVNRNFSKIKIEYRAGTISINQIKKHTDTRQLNRTQNDNYKIYLRFATDDKIKSPRNLTLVEEIKSGKV